MFLNNGSKLTSAETMQKLWNDIDLLSRTKLVPSISEITLSKDTSIAINEQIYSSVCTNDSQ
jgi:hypothetical protein